MKIDSYQFGKILINGKEYSKDVIISEGKVFSPWWRQNGHKVVQEDLKDFTNVRPQVVIFGTGYYGMVEVGDKVKESFTKIGVEVIICPTQEAVEKFNRLSEEGKQVFGAFHLTC